MIGIERMDMSKPLWQLTIGEFLELQKSVHPEVVTKEEVEYVYGLNGIAKLFGCSKSAAYELKRSGKIDKAITQQGRKIVVNSKMALELAGKIK